MPHHRSAQIVELAPAFVCTDKDSLFALPSTQYRLRLPFNVRVQAFTAKVGGPLYRPQTARSKENTRTKIPWTSAELHNSVTTFRLVMHPSF